VGARFEEVGLYDAKEEALPVWQFNPFSLPFHSTLASLVLISKSTSVIYSLTFDDEFHLWLLL
jgi:hypothetical protein